MRKYREISVRELMLWDENYRHGELKDEMTIINWFIQESADKVYNLAADILDKGILDPLIVVRNNNMFCVFDGNRRMTAIKLMLSPSLSADNNIKKRFRALRDRNTSMVDEVASKMPILIYEEEEAKVLIARRHNGEDGGRGIMPWKPEAQEANRQNSGEKSKYKRASFIKSYLEYTENLDLVHKSINEKGAISTWDRLLGFMNDVLILKDGTIKCSLKKTDFNACLNIIESKIKNKDLNSRTKKQDFLNIMGDIIKGYECVVPWENPEKKLPEKKLIIKKPGTSPQKRIRRGLIPPNFNRPPQDSSEVTQKFFDELSSSLRLNINSCPFSSASALRGFLESLFYDATDDKALTRSFNRLLSCWDGNQDYCTNLKKSKILQVIHKGAHGINPYKLTASELQHTWDDISDLIHFSYEQIEKKFWSK